MSREKVQQEALDLTLTKKRCGLGISMGVGKTRIAIEHLYSNYNPLITALPSAVIPLVPDGSPKVTVGGFVAV